jgi:hypothetical protein
MASVANNFSRVSIPSDVHKALCKEAKLLFEGFSVRDVKLIADEDHDGDPILRMTIEHRLVDKEVNLAEVRRKDSQLRSRAWDLGDSRFVHFRHVYDDQQEVSLSDE